MECDVATKATEKLSPFSWFLKSKKKKKLSEKNLQMSSVTLTFFFMLIYIHCVSNPIEYLVPHIINLTSKRSGC